MKLLGFGSNKLPSVIQDPFSKTKITGIYVDFTDFWGRGNWEASGRVTFQNGDTKGEQRFKGPTFDSVVEQIKAMIETL